MRWNRRSREVLDIPQGAFQGSRQRPVAQPMEQTFYRLLQEINKRKNTFMQKIYHGLRYQEMFAAQGRVLSLPHPSKWQQLLRSDQVIKDKLKQLLKVTLQLQQQAQGHVNYVAIVNAQLGDFYRIPWDVIPHR
jgi:hypothetical protein